ncbi:biotin-dependent carboxyltransferase family protein [Mesorhizobium sp. INR15]|uniref:5-oxoprolinase subunit C family protein n=1 Tax=Mesorhizobium sp. INR15 TaxID=2654248 RepID=UPI0018966653|nr:biotin-dependent carboxyltransferase family protein [Mesorhizobium sp. INR15]QPC95491.1 5-oxoprolinase/urea amidolyase family protein [Mesorhizobium sp. INR15]
MSVEVLSAGPMLTVQDVGRQGLRRFGVSTAGPMDGPALALANALCGNPPAAAALEFASLGGSFTTSRPLRFAVTGGDCDLRVDDRPLVQGESYRLNPGEVLKVGMLGGAVWGYIGFSGGISVPPTLGSRSTHLRSGLGGVEGRILRAGDILPLGPDAAQDVCLRPGIPQRPFIQGSIRIVLGPQDDYFTPDVLALLSRSAFVVTPRRDRMAMVLDGSEIPAVRGHDIVSDAVVPGSIQVPGSRQPMVLMAESQTTGGYPKIATVISADLPRLAQLSTGAHLRFAVVSRDEGEDIWLAHAKSLRATLAGLLPKSEGLLQSDYLLSCNLISGVIAADDMGTPNWAPDGSSQ